MNTWIWGPPTWRLLHTLSFSPATKTLRNPDLISNFLIALGYVLPCHFCRDSYDVFFRLLQTEKFQNQSLHDLIANGQLAEWTYGMHQLVNDKLNRQALIDVQQGEAADLLGCNSVTNLAAVSPTARSGRTRDLLNLLSKRQIGFECLAKRFEVRPVAFSDGDVWDMLKLFALNMDTMAPANKRGRAGGVSRSGVTVRENETEDTSTMQSSWFLFVALLPRVVEIAGGSRSLVSALQHTARITAQMKAAGDGVPRFDLRHARAREAWGRPTFFSTPGDDEGTEGADAPESLSDVPVTTFFHSVVAGYKQQLQEQEHQSCHCTGSSHTESSVSTTRQRRIYEVARARKCQDGSCK
jgi:hypothetical protein